ncbi:MAG TPA: glycosyltransferase family 2 protein [Pirellulales bacterium]|nr:glycosyltransferase family 2 protein [Pirellulales bacterium]
MAFGDEALTPQPFGADRPRFGELAGRFGIPAAAIEAALAEQRAGGGRLGQILVRRRVLAADQVSAILAWQAHWVATAAWQELKTRLPYPASLSLCLPAFNEEQAIGDTLSAALAILPKFVERFEVIVVDDGSRDQTAARVHEWSVRDDRIRLISHAGNRGYGAAVASGLRAATGELVMFADSDGQFDLLDVASLLGHLQDHDLAIGYRWRRAEAGQRRLNAWAWGALVRLVLGVRVRDLDCAFKLFRREALDQLQLTATGACINAEIMIQCTQAGMHYVETPVNHYPRVGGAATGSKASVIARAFRELPKLRRYCRPQGISPPHWRHVSEVEKPKPFLR